MKPLKSLPFLTTILGLLMPIASSDAGVYRDPPAPETLAAAQRNMTRVRKDLGDGIDTPAVFYDLPAISPIMRLPEDFPADGRPDGPTRLVGARGEYVPGSFAVFAFEDFTEATLTVSDLQGTGHTIPGDHVDLRIVKVWYQSGGGWHSYFADQTGRMRVPELLLHDEKLIMVDHDTRDNYLRVDNPEGANYVWISNPLAIDVPFNTQTEPVADALTLQPFTLHAGAFKQFWITVHIPKDAAAGNYRGTLTLTLGDTLSRMELWLRVLPFELPSPRTHYNLDRPFFTMLYNSPGYADLLKSNGGDHDHAERKLLAIFKNMRRHGIMHPRVPDLARGMSDNDRFALRRHLELMRRAGLDTTTLFGAIPGIPDYGWMTSKQVRGVPLDEQPDPDHLIRRVDAALEVVRATLGNAMVYCFGWDEPGRTLVISQRKPWQYIHDLGLKIFSTGKPHFLDYGGYNIDFINLAGSPKRGDADPWHEIGTRVLNYAGPHTGPENPDFMRRVHGLQLYKANFDGIGNYKLDSTHWNDFLGDVHNFRNFAMTYGTRDGVIDTLQWEGMREAVDDVRYATLLRTLAHRLVETGSTEAVYAARISRLWLSQLDEHRADLNLARQEMIYKILQLQTFEGATEP